MNLDIHQQIEFNRLHKQIDTLLADRAEPSAYRIETGLTTWYRKNKPLADELPTFYKVTPLYE
jgi:hypothetical protein